MRIRFASVGIFGVALVPLGAIGNACVPGHTLAIPAEGGQGGTEVDTGIDTGRVLGDSAPPDVQVPCEFSEPLDDQAPNFIIPSPDDLRRTDRFSYFGDNPDDEVVSDNQLGLNWQRKATDVDRDELGAEDYCKPLTLAKTTGWRLPTKVELTSLIDFDEAAKSKQLSSMPQTYVTAANKVNFPDLAWPNDLGFVYWTRTAVPNLDPANYWVIDFLEGYISAHIRTQLLFRYRCVKPSTRARPRCRFSTRADKTIVADSVTALQWERKPRGLLTPTDALDVCKTATTGGLSWRQPTMLELASLQDHTKTTPPAINTDVFPDTPADYFMSSSPGTKDTSPGPPPVKLDTYYVFDVKDGTSDRTDRNLGIPVYVRCVHTGL